MIKRFDLNILVKSYKFTNYVSEVVIYKKKKFKIEVSTTLSSKYIQLTIYGLSDSNMFKIATTNDLPIDSNKLTVSNDMSGSERIKALEKVLTYAEEYIKAICR